MSQLMPAATLDLQQLCVMDPHDLLSLLDAFDGVLVTLQWRDDRGILREHSGPLSVEGVEVDHDGTHGVELYVGSPNTHACQGYTLHAGARLPGAPVVIIYSL